jgi:hypothetical protein
MISPRIRIPSIVLAAVLIALAIGAVAVHASPACQRLVRTYITVPVRNRVSKATALAWARWRTGHPNWKSNPKVQRPRYAMTTQEAMDKVNFACETPAIPFEADSARTPLALLARTPLALEDTSPDVDLLDFSESPIAFQSGTPSAFPDGILMEDMPSQAGEVMPDSVANSWPFSASSIPPVLSSGPPSIGVPSSSTGVPSSPPIVSSESTPAIGVTAEPSTLLLVASGIGAGWLFCRQRPGSVK